MTPATDTLKIRSYEPSDKETVWRLHNEALHAVGAHLGNGAWDADLHEVEAVYLRGGGEFLVGLRGDRIVAMGALRRTSEERAEITRMRVSPDLQGRGIGGRLLEALENRAAGLGYATLHLDTTAGQAAARRLYEKNGYREVGRGTVGPFECLHLEKDLFG